MKFHTPCEFEIPDDWWQVAGMRNFKPLASTYNASSAPEWPMIVVALTDVEPPHRNPGVRWFDRDRMIQILDGFVNKGIVPAIEANALSIDKPHRFCLHDGFHRFYASAAAGFSHLPVSIRPYFDITDPTS